MTKSELIRAKEYFDSKMEGEFKIEDACRVLGIEKETILKNIPKGYTMDCPDNWVKLFYLFLLQQYDRR